MDLRTTNPTIALNVWHAKLGGQASRRYDIPIIPSQTCILQSNLSHPGLKPLNPSLLLGQSSIISSSNNGRWHHDSRWWNGLIMIYQMEWNTMWSPRWKNMCYLRCMRNRLTCDHANWIRILARNLYLIEASTDFFHELLNRSKCRSQLIWHPI